MIIDYAWWRPTPTQQAGVNGVLRYLSHDATKHVTAAELAELHGHGIGTGLVFEDAADRAGQGAAAGTADGQFCRDAMRGLGLPDGITAYAAVDFDIPDHAPASSDPRAKLGPVADYLAAFAKAAAPYLMGAYGGYWLVKRALDAHLTHRAWQTSAWSGGQIDQRICLYQPGVTLFDGNADLDLAGWRDWGQFRREAGHLITGPAA